MCELLESRAVPSSGFSARQVTVEMLQAADLILTMTRVHRGEVVELAPRIVRRSFTLKEFARLASNRSESVGEGLAAERWRRFLPVAVSMRGGVADGRSDDDVLDPIGQPLACHEAVFADLVAASCHLGVL